MNYWLVKSEPNAYSWTDLVKEKKTCWSGVRNYQARNNLASMKKGDLVLFYHSVVEKAVVGIAKVVCAAYPDPTIPEDARWLAIDIAPVKPIQRPLPLEEIKHIPELANMVLVKHGRLSVQPVTKKEFETIAQ